MQAVIDCVRKSYLCHEADPNFWGGIRIAGLRLLTRTALDRYRELMPDDENHQDEWEAVISDPEKYVSLLVGQIDAEEQREEADEENYYNCSEWEQTTRNYFLSYHEVRAHLHWVASRPAEAEAYKRFQVCDCMRLFHFVMKQSLIHLITFRCGTVSRRMRATPRGTPWGLGSIGASSR